MADGYFESAWRGLRALHDHPRRNELHYSLVFGYYLAIPKVGTLAALLDKKESEAGDYLSYCPDAVLSRETCSEHEAPEADWFDSAPVASDVVPQTLPIEPLWIEDDSPWPLPSVAVGLPDEDVAAVDTGATANNLTTAAWSRSLGIAERIGASEVTMQTGIVEAPLVRIRTLRLGDATFRRVAAHLGVVSSNVVGMTVLLRYDAVCFDWVREELVLGSLGRCAGGHVLEKGVRLNHSLMLNFDLLPRPPGLSPLERLTMVGTIDTGDHRTWCSENFLKLNGGARFSFGEHPDLVGKCIYDEHRDLPQSEDPIHVVKPKTVLVGMDTLRRFDAFGWRLRPLRLYFLPPKGGPEPLPNARSQPRQAAMVMCGKDNVKNAFSMQTESDRKFRAGRGGISITGKSVTTKTSIECSTSSDSGGDS